MLACAGLFAGKPAPTGNLLPSRTKHRVAITETRYRNLHLVTASPDLSDLQGKLESKFKINTKPLRL